MKKFNVLIEVQTTNDFKPKDFMLSNHDVCDGFELLRNGDDNTEEFKLMHARIVRIRKVRTSDQPLKEKKGGQTMKR